MNKRGQSIIEYMLIVVLVVLGVVIMGPYVLRSVNAHFKLWDEGVQDSFEEHFTQAPLNAVPPISTNCTCQDTSLGCGSSLVGPGCGPNQLNMNHNCTPQFCDGEPSAYCKTDPSCCTTYYPQGCGNVPIPAAWTDTGNDANQIPTGTAPPTPSNCYFGQRISSTQCSSVAIRCTADTCCDPSCQVNLTPGAISCSNSASLPANATWCPNANSDLDQNYAIVGVSDQSACTGAKCQLYCTPPYTYNPTKGDCEISAPTCNMPGQIFSFSYSSHQNLSTSDGNVYLTINCNTDGTVGGICWSINPRFTSAPCRGPRSGGLACAGSTAQVNCQPGLSTIYWQNGSHTSSWGYNVNCASGQLGNILSGASALPSAGIYGCNWSGTATILDFGAGNDMEITCTPNASGAGVIQSINIIQACNNGPSPGNCDWDQSCP